VKINGTSLLDLVGDSRQSFWGTSGYGGHTTLADELEIFRGDRIVGVDNPDFPI
jgi:phenylacetaldehyde dehydrogenase